MAQTIHKDCCTYRRIVLNNPENGEGENVGANKHHDGKDEEELLEDGIYERVINQDGSLVLNKVVTPQEKPDEKDEET